jgi:hypothetical protein
VVAQVDEQHAAMVSDAVAPAGNANGLADVAGAKRAASVGAVTVHGIPDILARVGKSVERARRLGFSRGLSGGQPNPGAGGGSPCCDSEKCGKNKAVGPPARGDKPAKLRY